ncbi:dephospho-CoA kinase [Notoacmeibacter sp. MSK16QG-6]|uniref:dephospho-CoA kinase n=1 Tax=Notoacmeibacter sp. MSK16QG-6 TaxID=2957982 RepID=UPI0020A1DEF2|nr:dephospho-CoA kinase [Notoacmeibacter sp. MSK16QG-6]MCP1199103.1 dephospho-CoA kinase [Notoacmeibacter sp. MSK16QG-6]
MREASAEGQGLGVKKIGLTGSIGMGKSTTARMFADEGVMVYDADAAVHRLYAKGGAAVDPVGRAFLGTVVDGEIDRDALRSRVVGDEKAMKKLEQIVHPLVRAEEAVFLKRATRNGAPFVVFDIPLLFETDGESRMDAVVVVSAPEEEQRRRVLERGTMTEAEFNRILERQVPDVEKRRRADFIIETGQGMEFARDQVREIIAQFASMDR